MDLKSRLPLLLAQRYKRLQYLQAKFENVQPSKTLVERELNELRSLLETYALLIAKLAKAGSGDELKETELRISSVERELTTSFESRRLATSSIGVMSTND